MKKLLLIALCLPAGIALARWGNIQAVPTPAQNVGGGTGTNASITLFVIADETGLRLQTETTNEIATH